jgi:hypothetical protein
MEWICIVVKDKKFSFTLGAGLHYYMGLSRLTMASTLNFNYWRTNFNWL